MNQPAKNPTGGRNRAWLAASLVLVAVVLAPGMARADGTNPAAALLSPPALPAAGPSLLRVCGALAVVLGLFLGCAWLFRHGRQLRFGGSRAAALRVLESRSLGGRHALYVIAYERERLLLASSPAGISLLTQLPRGAEPAENNHPQSAPTNSFAQALAHMMRKAPLSANGSGGRV